MTLSPFSDTGFAVGLVEDVEDPLPIASTAAFRGLTNRQKAAIVIAQMGPKRAVPIMNELSDQDAIALATEVADLPELEPRDNDPANIVLLGNLLGVVLADMCGRRNLAANLVASGQDLRSLVRCRAGGLTAPDIPLTRGWRATAILPELLAILDGAHAVRVVRPSSAAPLGYLPVGPIGTDPAPPLDDPGPEESASDELPAADDL